jgi:hypothetical protein
MIQKDFVRFCSVIGLWNGDNPKLLSILGNLLRSYRDSLGTIMKNKLEFNKNNSI